MKLADEIQAINLLMEQIQPAANQRITARSDSNTGLDSRRLQQASYDTDMANNPQKFAQNYPACVRSENPNVARVVKSKSGQYFMQVTAASAKGYQFYVNGKVLKPDGKMGNYACDGNNIIVDGIDIGEEWGKKWNQQNKATDWEKREREKAIAHSEAFWNPHSWLTIASIAAMFIPVVGPFVSAGISMGDAALYYKEGDTKMAGFVGFFACLPVIGAVASKIPAIAKLGSKGMQSLGAKLATNTTKNLTKTEIEVVNGLANNQALVTTEASNYFQSLAKQIVASPQTTQTAGQQLKQLAVGGVKMLVPYGAAGYGYHKGYDYLQRDTPKVMTSQEDIDWNTAKTAFGSSGSKEDNILLRNAWNKGWRPGKVVPQEFQTAAYKKNYEEEMLGIKGLEQLLAQTK